MKNKTPTVHAFHTGRIICGTVSKYGISKEVFKHRSKKQWKKYRERPCINCAGVIASDLKKEIKQHLDRLGL